MAKVLIAGCGYVGTQLGLELGRDGHEVWGLRRSASGLPDPIRPVAADLIANDLASVLPPEVEHVVYAASAGGRTEEAYDRAYVQGLERLLEALSTLRAPMRRLVFVSSTAVYGQTDGSWVDEHSPTEPLEFTGRTLLRGEALAAGGPCPATVLRLAGIYGPGRTRLITSVRDEAARRPTTPRFTNRIHRDDCAGAIRHILFDATKPDPIYIGVDDAPVEMGEILDWMARELGVASPPLKEGEPPAAMPGRGASHKRCRNDRLKASGYALRFPTYREGYAPLIAALRAPSTP